jgi:hypothetical protein
MLHIPSALDNATPPKTVTSLYLAKNDLSARERARLAADIIAGRVTVKLTVQQAARLCRVSVPYVNDARRPAGGGESLAHHFERSTPEEWRECARLVGPAVIWDQMLSPLVV